MPEHLADRLLSDMPFNGSLPIDIKALIRSYGVILEPRELTEHCWGMYIPVKDDVNVIAYSSSRPEEDIRFVLAHELYHYLDRRISPNKNQARFYMHDIPTERLANRFATRLLAPQVALDALQKLGKSTREMSAIFGVRPSVILARMRQERT